MLRRTVAGIAVGIVTLSGIVVGELLPQATVTL